MNGGWWPSIGFDFSQTRLTPAESLNLINIDELLLTEY